MKLSFSYSSSTSRFQNSHRHCSQPRPQNSSVPWAKDMLPPCLPPASGNPITTDKSKHAVRTDDDLQLSHHCSTDQRLWQHMDELLRALYTQEPGWVTITRNVACLIRCGEITFCLHTYMHHTSQYLLYLQVTETCIPINPTLPYLPRMLSHRLRQRKKTMIFNQNKERPGPDMFVPETGQFRSQSTGT